MLFSADICYLGDESLTTFYTIEAIGNFQERPYAHSSGEVWDICIDQKGGGLGWRDC